MFFPERGQSTNAAHALCSGCQVKADCLNTPLKNREPFGTWGRTNERDCRKLRRRATARL